jgi:hypothetical protein
MCALPFRFLILVHSQGPFLHAHVFAAADLCDPSL